ncbi:helix-turn-helix domain-containing protein [Maridesulfovibrio bastinii]|uniref:helix-turn-helix domain-containing protein n=1 Tax=Maridesulfovibrio bastinii TaxID=47157 RepID=UPI0004883ACD|nr:helix-turn-helix transcriptional regulator [Maridesulfovibrio bastinii]
MTNYAEIIGQNLRTLRKDLHLSQQQMAERADISYKYLGEIERGVVNLSVEILMKICCALQIAPEKLISTKQQANSSMLEAQAVLGELSPQQLEIALDMLKVLKNHSNTAD